MPIYYDVGKVIENGRLIGLATEQKPELHARKTLVAIVKNVGTRGPTLIAVDVTRDEGTYTYGAYYAIYQRGIAGREFPEARVVLYSLRLPKWQLKEMQAPDNNAIVLLGTVALPTALEELLYQKKAEPDGASR